MAQALIDEDVSNGVLEPPPSSITAESAARTNERLLRIEENFMIQKKTGVGRAAAGVVTLGTNLVVAGNKRGTLYLSLVTESGTATLKEDPPTDSGVRRASALALAGRAAIDGATRSADVPRADEESTPPLSVEERLQRLKDLLERGVITEDEYASSRAQILKSL